MKDFYSTEELAEAGKCSIKTVQLYNREGLLTAQLGNDGRQGSKRYYSKKNLFQLFLIRKLMLTGFDTSVVRKTLDELETVFIEREENPVLIIMKNKTKPEHVSCVFTETKGKPLTFDFTKGKISEVHVFDLTEFIDTIK